ncbi:glutamyl-tRNA amidotransferase, A subunit [Paecilomyces variotii No. 5]|uniref:Glutamyl-tRNA(Gln) amidotransferase subunit A, mitochondrial n=1 Tax=Byssochlamys spectabilis (strain No. 5 / NBRC 109023) TaxID=1356009 RepID=V5I058_BYSSN|nr:glutamyl-tRNA amidotransferase, A subunit [Paecilomyces variotii No. 5]
MSVLREAERCILNQQKHAALNAFITPLQRSGPWLDSVRDADARRQHGSSQSPLDGKLVAVKDNICTRDLPTTCASGILEKFNSPFNATVVEKLGSAGAVVAGKTNLDEFGMGSHSTQSWFGPVKQHRKDGGHELSAGGSSGGSAVAVATEQCYAALGTDTGGSVRLPAAYTGTVGFKPSYGLISRWGVVPYANSLDTVGIIGRETAAVREVFDLDVLNHHDHRDPTSLSQSTRSRIIDQLAESPLSKRLVSRPLRVGVPIEYNISELAPPVRDAWLSSLRHLQKQGHTIHPVSLPATKLALSAYYVIAPAEASSNLAKYDGIRYGSRAEGPDSGTGPDGYLYARTRGEKFGAEVQRRILLGAFTLSAHAMDNYFIQAQKVRRLVQADFDNVFSRPNPLASSSSGSSTTKPDPQHPPNDLGVDVLISPTAPSSPPNLSSLTDPNIPPVNAYISDVFTVPASLAGLPAISVPARSPESEQGTDMIGIQVIGQFGDDDLVMRVSDILEGAGTV